MDTPHIKYTCAHLSLITHTEAFLNAYLLVVLLVVYLDIMITVSLVTAAQARQFLCC